MYWINNKKLVFGRTNCDEYLESLQVILEIFKINFQKKKFKALNFYQEEIQVGIRVFSLLKITTLLTLRACLIVILKSTYNF